MTQLSLNLDVDTVLYPGPNHGYTGPLDPNVIDQHAIRAFTLGQCHALALAIHEQTGWPLVTWGYWHSWGHVAAVHPDGDQVDINGKQPLSEKQGFWYGDGSHPIEPEDVPDLPHAYRITNEGMETARHFARLVLEGIES